MSTHKYKCPPARLARLFLRSRDLWKARSADKQRTIRSLRVTVRDLGTSRDHWKTLAQQQAHELEQLRAGPPPTPSAQLPVSLGGA